MDKDGIIVGIQCCIGCLLGFGIYLNDVMSFLIYLYDEWVVGISNYCWFVFGCFFEGCLLIVIQESQFVIVVKLVVVEVEQYQYFWGVYCYDISDDLFVGFQYCDSGVRSLFQS